VDAAATVTITGFLLSDPSKPVRCANCHSFSRDGKTLGMDLDGPGNDKGQYALAEVKPQMSIRNHGRAAALSQKGDSAPAIFHLKKAVWRKPDSAELHNRLGSTLFSQQKGNEAVQHFRIALEIHPILSMRIRILASPFTLKGRQRRRCLTGARY